MVYIVKYSILLELLCQMDPIKGLHSRGLVPCILFHGKELARNTHLQCLLVCTVSNPPQTVLELCSDHRYHHLGIFRVKRGFLGRFVASYKKVDSHTLFDYFYTIILNALGRVPFEEYNFTPF